VELPGRAGRVQNIGEVSEAIPEVIFAALVASVRWVTAHARTAARLIGALAEAHDLVNDPAQDATTPPVYQRITVPDDPELVARGLAYTRGLGMWPAGLGRDAADTRAESAADAGEAAPAGERGRHFVAPENSRPPGGVTRPRLSVRA
jgi:hypothetical protein